MFVGPKEDTVHDCEWLRENNLLVFGGFDECKEYGHQQPVVATRKSFDTKVMRSEPQETDTLTEVVIIMSDEVEEGEDDRFVPRLISLIVIIISILGAAGIVWYVCRRKNE